MNSDMVKPEKFGHLHLVYHFTVPLRTLSNNCDEAFLRKFGRKLHRRCLIGSLIHLC